MIARAVRRQERDADARAAIAAEEERAKKARDLRLDFFFHARISRQAITVSAPPRQAAGTPRQRIVK